MAGESVGPLHYAESFPYGPRSWTERTAKPMEDTIAITEVATMCGKGDTRASSCGMTRIFSWFPGISKIIQTIPDDICQIRTGGGDGSHRGNPSTGNGHPAHRRTPRPHHLREPERYLCYRPHIGVIESDRNVISNIHHGGIPPLEAGAVISDFIQSFLKHRRQLDVRLKAMNKL